MKHHQFLAVAANLRGSFRRLLPGALCASLVLLAACSKEGSETKPTSGAPSATAGKTPAADPARAELATTKANPSTTPAEVLPSADKPAAEKSAEPKPDTGSVIATGKDAAPGSPTGKIEVDQADHDFGEAIEGEILTHVFPMRSNGAADLIITSAKPTCGCTVAKLEVKQPDGQSVLYKFGDPITPGTQLELTAQLDTKNKHNIAASKVNIFCNDPRQTVTLGLTARVDTYFRIGPPALDFGEISIADVVQKDVEIAGKKPGPFMLSMEPNKPLAQGMKVDLVPVDPDAEGRAERWTMKVTLGPDCREGNLGYPISVRSDELVAGAAAGHDGVVPTYGVSVMTTARVRGLISFEPQYLSFGLVRPGQVLSRTLEIKSYDPNFSFGVPTMRLVGPNDQKPEFKWGDKFTTVALPSADSKTLKIELTLNGLPEEADGSFQGRLMVNVGHPSKPEVAVLFSGVCRPGVKTATPGAATTDPAQPTQGGGGK